MDIDIMERAFKEYTRWRGENLPEDLAAELMQIAEDPD